MKNVLVQSSIFVLIVVVAIASSINLQIVEMETANSNWNNVALLNQTMQIHYFTYGRIVSAETGDTIHICEFTISNKNRRIEHFVRLNHTQLRSISNVCKLGF